MIQLPNTIQQLFQKGIISVVEYEFVRFLLQLDQHADDEVLLAAAACVHAQINGHVCLDFAEVENQFLFNDPESEIKITASISEKWLSALENSSLVGKGSDKKPLILDDKRLYLQRFWKYEQELANWILDKSQQTTIPDEDAVEVIKQVIGEQHSDEVNWQHVALCLSFMKDLVVISGGPGTGKTFTVLNIIAAHIHHQKNKKYKVALAAPTGKAARRLAQSIAAGKQQLPKTLQEGLEISEEALTVHKLLGSDFQGSNFKFNAQNKLPYDLVVIDEASMLDITMWVRLVRAIHNKTKLIVLGDKDQLASVEAGSILGDICGGENAFSEEIVRTVQHITGEELAKNDELPAINDSVVFLTKSYRFDEKSGIQKLANAINNSDADEALRLLKSPEYPDLRLQESSRESMSSVIQEYATQHYRNYMEAPEEQRLHQTNQKKILCVLRRGPFGVEYLNADAEKRIKQTIPDLSEEWYPGRVIMAKRNDSLLKIRNGEIGICFQGNENRVQFEGESKAPISTTRLQEYEPAYAITIHKSQGSEFDEVAIVLPNTMNPLLSKEILYTSVTRARRSTLVIGNEDIIRQTIDNTVRRSSGLKDLIWKSSQ